MREGDINETTLLLLKLSQLQESYISFLELEITAPQHIAIIHGWKPSEAVVKTGEQLRKLIKELKDISGYDQIKNVIIKN